SCELSELGTPSTGNCSSSSKSMSSSSGPEHRAHSTTARVWNWPVMSRTFPVLTASRNPSSGRRRSTSSSSGISVDTSTAGLRQASDVLVAALAAATVGGCGGSSVGSRSATGGTGSTTPTNTLATTLTATGVIQTSYLTGSSRVPDGTQIFIDTANYTDVKGI